MTTGTGSLPAAADSEVDRFLDDRLVEYDVPGASVAIVDRNGVQYATGLGARTLDPVNPRRRTRCFTPPR